MNSHRGVNALVFVQTDATMLGDPLMVNANCKRMKTLSMMTDRQILVRCLAAFMLVFTTNGHASAPDPLESVAKSYALSLSKLSTEKQKALESLQNAYLQRVSELETHFRKAKNWSGLLAAQKERKRFKKAASVPADAFEINPELPPSTIVDSPKALKDAQREYLKLKETQIAPEEDPVETLHAAYCAKLREIRKAHVQEGNSDEAARMAKELQRARIGDFSVTLRLAREAAPDATIPELLQRETIDPIEIEFGVTNEPDTNPAVVVPPSEQVPPDKDPEPEFSGFVNWKYKGVEPFCADLNKKSVSGIPNELNAYYNRRSGVAKFSGHCATLMSKIMGDPAYWFGKVVIWDVPRPRDLRAEITFQSKYLSHNRDYGPLGRIGVVVNGKIKGTLTVRLTEKTIPLKLAYHALNKRATLSTIQPKRQSAVDIPDDASVQIFVAVTVKNPGERCETMVDFRSGPFVN